MVIVGCCFGSSSSDSLRRSFDSWVSRMPGTRLAVLSHAWPTDWFLGFASGDGGQLVVDAEKQRERDRVNMSNPVFAVPKMSVYLSGCLRHS